MSEEEKKAIEDLRKTIDYYDKRFKANEKITSVLIDNFDVNNLYILLNLIEKYKVELIETKEANRQLGAEIEQLEKENIDLEQKIWVLGYSIDKSTNLLVKKIEATEYEPYRPLDDYIPKSVIREKIDRLKREFDFYAGREHAEWQDGEFDGEVCDDLALQIKALKELLEAKDE